MSNTVERKPFDKDSFTNGEPRCPSCKTPWVSHLGLTGLCEQIRRLEGSLRRIQSMAGNPNAAAGCRAIIKEATDALGESQ